MDFDLNEDQKEIRSVARDLLAARSPFARVREAAEAREYDVALWREICELGWPGIAVGEQYGGQGMGIVELAVLLEELGYACAAVPFLSTAVAATIVDRCGSEALRERVLPGLVSGSVSAGIGRPGLVVDGAGAAVTIVLGGGAAGGGGGGGDGALGDGAFGLVDAAADPRETIDATRRFATLDSGVSAGVGSVAGAGADGAESLGADAASLVLTAVSAELVGVCRRALEMTLAYVSERRQFGVPVGAFQAVSHRCAEMLLHTESVRSTAYHAAWAADAGAGATVSLGEAAALAAAAAATAGREVAASAIQAHGGIGFTWEADVHWLYKRAEVDRALLGGASVHRGALARAAAARVA